MHQEENDLNKFGHLMQFGECGDSNSVYFANVRDVNGQQIKIPYDNPKSTLQSLLDSYHLYLDSQQISKPLIFRNFIQQKRYQLSQKIQTIKKQLQKGEIQLAFPLLININVKTQDNKMITIEIDYYCPIYQLKQKIFSKLGQLVINQVLKSSKQQILQDDKTLKQYKLNSQSIILLKIIQKDNIEFLVYVKINQKQILQIKVKPYEVIKDLKQKIRQLIKIPLQQQILLYQSHVLLDNIAFIEYDIKQKNCLNLIHKKINKKIKGYYDDSIHIYIRVENGETLQIIFSKKNRIIQLKQQISYKYGYTIELQRLEYAGKMMENNLTFYDYGIQKQQIICMTLKLSDIIIQQKLILMNQYQQTPKSNFKMKIKLENGTYIETFYDLQQSLHQILSKTQKLYKIQIKKGIFKINDSWIYDFSKQIKQFNYFEEQYVQLIRVCESDLVEIKLSQTDTIQVQYEIISQMMVSEVIEEFCQNPKPYYCLLFGGQIIEPTMRISQIQKFKIINQVKLTFKVLKNVQKLIFNKFLISDPKFNFTQQKFPLSNTDKKQFEKSQKRISQTQTNIQLVKKEFYNPFLYYTCTKFYKNLNKFLLNNIFDNSYQNCKNNQSLLFANLLINSLRKLPNHIGQVHRGLHNFRFSKSFTVGNCFYWRSFTSTSIKVENANTFKCKNGTLCHINSLTGKNISKFSFYPTEEEVLFEPYTYFIVQKIDQRATFDEVWLAQMPSPQKFSKNLIVWVDDQPEKNSQYISQIKSQIQIIPSTSTKMAQQWMKQFGWLLNWKGVNLKIISDMVRVQMTQNGNIMNYYAGIDLIQILYNNYNFSTPILIFCGDKGAAIQNIKKRKTIKSRIYKVTDSFEQFEQYIKQVNIQDEQKREQKGESTQSLTQMLGNPKKKLKK